MELEFLDLLFGAVLGIFSGSVALFSIYLLHFKFPNLFSINPFHFIGSMVFTDVSGIYIFGSLCCGIIFGILGIIYTYAYSFEGSIILVTVLLILVQYIIFGILLGVVEKLHPAITSDEFSKPNYFWLKDDKFNGIVFCFANLCFGIIIYLGYSIQ